MGLLASSGVRVPCLILAACLFGGCASVRTRAHVMSLTPDNPTLQQSFESVREGNLDEKANHVLLFVESYPEGVEPVGHGEIRVRPDSKYELVTGYDLYATGATTFWFADYVSTGKKVYCYPQVPLTWVTLGLWQIVPLAWPCDGVARMDQPLVWAQVRHLAAVADGDAAIVQLKMADERIIDAWGWVLRAKQREQPPPDVRSSSSPQ